MTKKHTKKITRTGTDDVLYEEMIEDPDVVEFRDGEVEYDAGEIEKLFGDLDGSRNFMPVHPSRSYKTIDKVSNSLVKVEPDGRQVSLRMEPRGASIPVTTRLSLNYMGVDITGKERFTSFDREVSDALVTLYITLSMNGQEVYFTPKMVWQAMIGRSNARMTENQMKLVTSSIDKMSFLKVNLDIRQESERFGYDFDAAEISGNMINVEKVRFRISSNETTGYRFLARPILLAYAQPKHQVASVDIRLLDTPLNKSEKVIILQGYLLRRIEAMKGSKLSHTILYDTVYKVLEEQDAPRQKKQETRKAAEEILNYWVANKYIHGYEILRKGKKIHGVSIELNTQAQALF